MSETNVEGVVLRRWDSGESDRRVALFTRERGKIYAIARGARKANARLSGVCEPGVYARIAIASGRRNFYITQAQTLASHAKLRDDYIRLSCALAFLETVDALMQEGDPAEEVLNVCRVALDGIEKAKEPLGALCWGDLCLLQTTGYAPEFGVSVANGNALKGSRIALSPEAGGALNDGEAELRSKIVDAEIVITLAKMQSLDCPPDFVKRAADCVRALSPFLSAYSHSDLPARRSLLNAIG